MSDGGQNHRDAEFVGGGNDIGILLASAGLDHSSDASGGGGLDAVREWEEGVTGENGALGSFTGLLKGEADGLDAVHLASADAKESIFRTDDDGIGLHVRNDAPLELESGHLLGSGSFLCHNLPFNSRIFIGILDDGATSDGLDHESCFLGRKRGGEEADVLAPARSVLEDFDGFFGKARADDDFEEVAFLGHGVGGVGVDFGVEGGDASEGGDGVALAGEAVAIA